MIRLLPQTDLFEFLDLQVEKLNLPEEVSVDSGDLNIFFLEFGVLFDELSVFFVENVLAHLKLFAPDLISMASFANFLDIFLEQNVLHLFFIHVFIHNVFLELIFLNFFK
jgi:hypothetical protein